MKGEPVRIVISARGTYPAEMPESLREALAFEVQRHMEGYGCTAVLVTVDASPSQVK